MPAPVMGDDPVAVLQEEQHLGVPVVGRKRPAMAEDNRLARAPVLVEDLRAIGRRNRTHALPPLVWLLPVKAHHWQRNHRVISTPDPPATAAVAPAGPASDPNLTGH